MGLDSPPGGEHIDDVHPTAPLIGIDDLPSHRPHRRPISELQTQHRTSDPKLQPQLPPFTGVLHSVRHQLRHHHHRGIVRPATTPAAPPEQRPRNAHRTGDPHWPTSPCRAPRPTPHPADHVSRRPSCPPMDSTNRARGRPLRVAHHRVKRIFTAPANPAPAGALPACGSSSLLGWSSSSRPPRQPVLGLDATALLLSRTPPGQGRHRTVSRGAFGDSAWTADRGLASDVSPVL